MLQNKITPLDTEFQNFSLHEFQHSATVLLMNTLLQINSRGTLTLPKFVRKALGVGNGGVIMLDFRDNGVFLQPAAAFPIEMYTNDRIAEFDEADLELGKRMAKKGRSRETFP